MANPADTFRKYQMMLDEAAEHCGMVALHAGLARDHAAAGDPVAVKYSLRRLTAYLRAATGVIDDIEAMANDDRKPKNAPQDYEDIWI